MGAPRIAFIGAGNMASSIIGGLLESGHPAAAIRAADPFPQSLERIASLGDIATFSDNNECATGMDVIILAVKPQVMGAVAQSIAGAVQASSGLVISIAAGITIESLQRRLGKTAAIVRCMPNTPALLGCGASGMFANSAATPAQRAHAEHILEAVGIIQWVEDESQLDAVTALSGSGPAYFFLFMEAMIEAGCELGLDRATAGTLAMQTALGAARMALESDVDLAELRRRVTSPGGTTERAIQSLTDSDLQATVRRAMQAASDRAAEMAREMG